MHSLNALSASASLHRRPVGKSSGLHFCTTVASAITTASGITVPFCCVLCYRSLCTAVSRHPVPSMHTRLRTIAPACAPIMCAWPLRRPCVSELRPVHTPCSVCVSPFCAYATVGPNCLHLPERTAPDLLCNTPALSHQQARSGSRVLLSVAANASVGPQTLPPPPESASACMSHGMVYDAQRQAPARTIASCR